MYICMCVCICVRVVCYDPDDTSFHFILHSKLVRHIKVTFCFYFFFVVRLVFVQILLLCEIFLS